MYKDILMPIVQGEICEAAVTVASTIAAADQGHLSALVGVSKPDPAIFAEALRRLDAPAAAALHVGDHPRNDLAGARAAGLAALLLDRAGAHAQDVAPEDRIRSLAELPGRMDAG